MSTPITVTPTFGHGWSVSAVARWCTSSPVEALTGRGPIYTIIELRRDPQLWKQLRASGTATCDGGWRY
eukprot:10742726-Heterocapsa_arctica.AAC.1